MLHQPPCYSPTKPLRWLMLGAAVVLLLYVALLAAFSHTGFPTSMSSPSHWPALVDKPVGEDGYYMLTVAENIARNGRIVYNGGMPATGIQPLATMVFAGLDYFVHLFGGGSAALIRSVMALGTVLFVLLAFQMGRIARALAPRERQGEAETLAFLLTLCSFTLFRLFTYGLETGVYLVLIAACFQITLRIAEQGRASVRNTVLLGLAAGFAGEARIDFGLLFAILLCVMLLYGWLSWVGAAVAGGIALLVVSPWFWFVHRVSGSWLPSSGKAESTMITGGTVLARLQSMAVAVAGAVMPWCYGVVSRATVAVALVSVVLLVLFVAGRREGGALLRGAQLRKHEVMWLVCLASLVPVYLVLFNSTHFYYRYVAPLAVVSLPLCAIVLVHAAWVRQHLLTVTAVLFAMFAGWAAGSLHSGRVGNSQTIAAGYVHRNFPAAHVGAFQSGVMGFFNRNVENLDGKLNSGALQATAQQRLPQFVDSEHIDVLVDWPSVLRANLPADYLQREWQPCPVPMVGNGESICLLRKSTAEDLSLKPRI